MESRGICSVGMPVSQLQSRENEAALGLRNLSAKLTRGIQPFLNNDLGIPNSFIIRSAIRRTSG